MAVTPPSLLTPAIVAVTPPSQLTPAILAVTPPSLLTPAIVAVTPIHGRIVVMDDLLRFIGHLTWN